MSERINKLILETEFKATGDITPSTQRIEELTKATDKAKGSTIGLIEAEKQLERAAAQAGVQVQTETKKTSELGTAIQNTGKAMKDVAQTNTLKSAFDVGNTPEKVNKLLKEFEKTARAAQSVEELDAAVQQLLADLPEDVRADAFKLLQKETEKLEKSIGNPVSRLRELKKLIATTDDPVLLKKLNEEAAQLTDALGDNQDLINALASDTFYTDTLVQGAQTAVSAFTAFQGALTLVTDDQEELARVAAKAQGALALLQGTQTLLNELKKSDNIITRAQIASQKIYASVVGQSTGATKGLRIALASLGIGALVIGIGLLAANWDKVRAAISGVTDEQRQNNAIKKEAIAASVAENVQLEIAKAKLVDVNTSQEDRVNLIKDLQEQYPSYLSNLDAEKVGNEELFAILGKINQALFLKFQIQAREKQLEPLFQARVEAEDEYQKRLLATSQTYEAATRQERALLEKRNDNLANNSKKALDEIDKQIQDVIAKILKDSQDLNLLGGDPTTGAVETGRKYNQAVKEAYTIKEGTIEFLQKQVSDLSNKVTKELQIGTDEFVEAIDELILAQQRLKEAQDLLGGAGEFGGLTEGSLKALRLQASLIQDVIDSLPAGDELLGKVEELKVVQAQIDELLAIINGKEAVEEKRASLLDLLDEEARYQQASLDIQGATNLERLDNEIKFQEERVALLKAQGADDFQILQEQNNLDLLLQKRKKAVSEANKELFQQIADGFTMVIEKAIEATQAFLALKQEENARLIELQQQRVSDAREIADRGNAVILEAEQERLNELNKQQAEYARKQIAIATAQMVAESALAIAKAASQGGVLAPFTIAATLIALAAGFAQARQQASAATASVGSFRKGGYTGDGDPNSVSTNLGNKPYEYHKSEFVIPHEVLSIGNNRRWLDKIHLQRLDMDKLFTGKSPTVIVNNDSKQVVEAIRGIPQTEFRIDSKGIYTINKRHELAAKRRNSQKRRR